MIRRPPRSTLSSSSAASDVYKRQVSTQSTGGTTALAWSSEPPINSTSPMTEPKTVYRTSKTVPRAPYFDAKTKLPGWGGFVPGAAAVIEKNYYETSQACFDAREEFLKSDALARAAGARRSFKPPGSMRSHAGPSAGEAAKYLPGYQGYVPGGRFQFECSEGHLAKTWAPRSPIHGAAGTEAVKRALRGGRLAERCSSLCVQPREGTVQTSYGQVHNRVHWASEGRGFSD
eukprot:TRINITY_DN49518_c0_g1_i1.p1 TRINITY_DN49518_c0_g1~~TRINITY_DN49518_c0_g1_i1.p1  ORF type:complete len:231 (-),score=34.62 TRINITY_DN49518_c0_g1_i1:413-1105(-)